VRRRKKKPNERGTTLCLAAPVKIRTASHEGCGGGKTERLLNAPTAVQKGKGKEKKGNDRKTVVVKRRQPRVSPKKITHGGQNSFFLLKKSREGRKGEVSFRGAGDDQ